MEKDKYQKSFPYTLILVILGIVLIAVVVFSFFLGRFPISPIELFSIVLSNIFPITQTWTDQMETVLYNIRLPRILLACLVGCCLSAAGASFQGIFQNPMAAPDILGATAGAAFGAALAILNDGNYLAISLSAFVFSLLTVSIVYFISGKARGSKILGLILSGIIIGSLFSAGTSYLKLVADPSDELPAITYWLMGSLSGATKSTVGMAAIPMTLGLIPMFLIRWRINVLTLGDQEARTMGISATRLRLFLIVCATLVTAASVSVSGMIGWVGLVIPHLARRLVGNNYKHLMPASMLLGATFLLIVDDVSRNLLQTEIPIGILTAFIGAPFFVYLITKKGEVY
ncbi:MAG TPA: iron ABC transporter permease [Candidatus Limnocylindrales bacterium]|nr:iron ABC transporter permease [Candidatus Limnocylindrales bacterium]